MEIKYSHHTDTKSQGDQCRNSLEISFGEVESGKEERTNRNAPQHCLFNSRVVEEHGMKTRKELQEYSWVGVVPKSNKKFVLALGPEAFWC